MPYKKKMALVFSLLLTTALLLILALPAMARPEFLDKIPPGGEKSCNYCHSSVPNLNATGQQFKAAGYKFPAAESKPAPAQQTQEPKGQQAPAAPKSPATPASATARPAPSISLSQYQLTGGVTQQSAQGTIINQRLMLAVRPLARALGGQVTWDGRAATITTGGKQIVLQPGQTTGTVDGQGIKLVQAPRLHSGSLLVPARSVAEAAGYQVTLAGKVLTLTKAAGAPTAPQVSAQQPAVQQVAQAPRRGCAACHVGKYTLYREAEERAKARGGEHPTVALDGTPLDDNTQVTTCLDCHKPGADGKGYAAPLSLRDIVHPAHMGSEHFVDNYRGNCFTCHNVDGNGTFQLLTEKVEVNEKGVPEVVPIPGAISPSEK